MSTKVYNLTIPKEKFFVDYNIPYTLENMDPRKYGICRFSLIKNPHIFEGIRYNLARCKLCFRESTL